MSGILVLQPRYIDGYRVNQSVQDKAWVAGNGYSLVKIHNAVLDALVYSRRASQKAVIHVVALFVKGITIHCKVRLVANRFLTRCIRQFNAVGILMKTGNVFCHPNDSFAILFVSFTSVSQVTVIKEILVDNSEQ